MLAWHPSVRLEPPRRRHEKSPVAAGTPVSRWRLPVVLIAAWWITSADSQSFYFPPLQTIVQTFVELWFSPQALVQRGAKPGALLHRLSRGGIPRHRHRRSDRRLAQSAQRARAGAGIPARHSAAGVGAGADPVRRHRRRDEGAGDRVRLHLAGAAQYRRRRARARRGARGDGAQLSDRPVGAAVAFRAARARARRFSPACGSRSRSASS